MVVVIGRKMLVLSSILIQTHIIIMKFIIKLKLQNMIMVLIGASSI